MAEKIIDIEINTSEAIAETLKLKESLAVLKKESEKYVSEQDKMTQGYIENQAEIKATNELIRKNETMIKNVTKANLQNVDSIAQMDAQLAAVTAEWSKYTQAQIQEGGKAAELNKQKTELTEKLKELRKATGDHRMEVGNYNMTMKGLKQELKELKGILQTGADGTEEYNNALKRAAEITDDLGDMQERIKGTAMDFDGVMGNVGKVTSGVASAFEAAQGAAMLFGEESEDLQKAMLKVQASIALANGLQGLGGMGKAFNNLLTQIKIFAQGVNKALLSTGIGAFIALTGLIVANWDKIKEAISGVSSEQKKLGVEAQKNLKIEKAKTQELEDSENLLRLQGKTEKQILEMKVKQLDAEIEKAEIALQVQTKIKSQQVEAESRNLKILQKGMEPVMFILKFIDETVAKLGKFVGKKWDLGLSTMFGDFTKWSQGFLADPEEAKADAIKELQEQAAVLLKMRNARAGLQLELQEIDKKGRKERTKESEKQLKSELELTEKFSEQIAASAEKLNKKLQKQANLKKEIALQAVAQMEFELEQFRLTEAAKLTTVQERAQQMAEFEASIAQAKFDNGLISEIEYNAGISRIKSESREIQKQAAIDAQILQQDAQYEASKNDIFSKLDLEQQMLEESRAKEIAYAESIGAETYWINEKYNDAELELERAKQDAKLNLASQFFGNIASLAGEGTAIGKAAAVAQTTISTYQAATGAYAALAGIPVVGPVLGIAAAAAAVADGLRNVKKILAVKSGLPESGVKASAPNVSSGGGGGQTHRVSMAPTVNQGIVSRETLSSGTNNKITLQPTLVIDDVTRKQIKVNANNNTSIL